MATQWVDIAEDVWQNSPISSTLQPKFRSYFVKHSFPPNVRYFPNKRPGVILWMYGIVIPKTSSMSDSPKQSNHPTSWLAALRTLRFVWKWALLAIPSGDVKIALENGHLVRWFIHSAWRFSIVMLVYQRVPQVMAIFSAKWGLWRSIAGSPVFGQPRINKPWFFWKLWWFPQFLFSNWRLLSGTHP